MTEIAELQRRLRDALNRIGGGLDGLEAPQPAPAFDPAELEQAKEALAAEKEANAQFEERLRSLREKMERMEREQRTAIDRLKQELADGEIQMQRMRRTNTQLRQSIQGLREAAETGVVDARLIDQAMMSELEGLRTVREGDRAEMDAILGELLPLLEEHNNA